MRTCLLKGNSKTCIFVNFHKLIVDLYTKNDFSFSKSHHTGKQTKKRSSNELN